MEQIYSLRKNFTIIGLTGTMGSGCSKLAELLTKDKEIFFNVKMIRNPKNFQLKDENGEAIYENVLFQRKYQICYNFMQKNWSKYVFIDYKKVLFLYCFNYFINVKKSKNLTKDFSIFINSTFSKAPISDKDNFDDFNKLINKKEVSLIMNSSDIKLDLFIKKMKDIIGGDDVSLIDIKDESKLKLLYDEFFVGTSDFNNLYKKFNTLFNSKNYYLKSLFFHKIGCSIRGTGNPEGDYLNSTTDNAFNIARLINRLIKAFKNCEIGNDKCQIVINSLKNSLEIMYFKERYSAFYMMAVHSEEADRKKIFVDIVKEPSYKSETIVKLMELDKTEYLTRDFKKGLFSSPDIENCIQKSDIHVIFKLPKGSLDSLPLRFDTLHEQLLKYLSLIQQPGIITPSNIERCMQIAFNSKLNSGCVSRQVGAIVTNEGFSVKAIGWNDTPKKTIPCLLRNIEEVMENSFLDCEDHTYSDFELPKSSFKYILNKNFNIAGKPSNEQYINKNFSENVRSVYTAEKLSVLKEEGKNCSYCFKTLHNSFVGEENQVHTRSLHAEENAMLQISKFGGQGLKNGYLFVTASPCELCSKKSYQIGITQIYYIDKYPGIAKDHIIGVGFDAPKLNQFNGIVGRSFNKLYEPFLAYKDELKIYLKN